MKLLRILNEIKRHKWHNIHTPSLYTYYAKKIEFPEIKILISFTCMPVIIFQIHLS